MIKTIATKIWYFAERNKIKLGPLGPIVFGHMMQSKCRHVYMCSDCKAETSIKTKTCKSCGSVNVKKWITTC